MKTYDFLPDLLLRTPSYSHEDYNLDKLALVIRQPFFKAALFLANPGLFGLLEKKAFDHRLLAPREKLTLAKYYNRMSFRPTPFGAFSGFTPVCWGAGEVIRLGNLQESELHLQLDQAVLRQLDTLMFPTGDPGSAVRVNPTVYRLDREYRFIRGLPGQSPGATVFVLEAIPVNPVLEFLFSRAPGHGPLKELAAELEIVLATEAALLLDYLLFLTEVQFLVSPAQRGLTGEDHLRRLCSTRAAGKFAGPHALYQETNRINTPDIGQLTRLSAKLSREWDKWGPGAIGPVFYSGLENKRKAGDLAEGIQKRLITALQAIRYLQAKNEATPLDRFKQAFVKRFDRRKVPLLEAMDPDCGIGYNGLEQSDNLGLLEDIDFKKRPAREAGFRWSAFHRLLLRKWPGYEQPGQGIILSQPDLDKLDMADGILPPTLSVMFRVLEGEGLLLEAVSPVTATSLIGRFTAWSAEVKSIGKRLASAEQQANPGILFAEILQQSGDHTDNINRRAQLYDYEIPVNTLSSLPEYRQIALSDLMVSVLDDRIVLESFSRQKTVVPRLSSAYNFTRSNLSVFRFLCDLQEQGLAGLQVPDPERFFPGLDHYPRLSFDDVILAPARWYLKPEAIFHVPAEDRALCRQSLATIALQLKWPRQIALTRHDQQLVFDLSVPAECDLFLDVIKGGTKIRVQEYLSPARDLAGTIGGSSLVNQFIAFLYQKEAGYPAAPRPAPVRRGQQDYIPGSKWLYLKLYCSPATSNRLMVRKIIPLVRQIQKSYPMRWFFIRYADDGYHFRLRFNIPEANLEPVIRLFKDRLNRDVQAGTIQDYQAGTYRPEWERYGFRRMGLVEDFFHCSTELVAAYLKKTMAPGFAYAYHTLAFVLVLDMLPLFLPGPEEQTVFLSSVTASLYPEFSSDKTLRIALDRKFRELKPELTKLLEQPGYYQSLRLVKQQQAFHAATERLVLSDTPGRSEIQKRLLADLIHMHLNRLFVEEQRKNELVVYYMLLKYRQARMSRGHQTSR